MNSLYADNIGIKMIENSFFIEARDYILSQITSDRIWQRNVFYFSVDTCDKTQSFHQNNNIFP